MSSEALVLPISRDPATRNRSSQLWLIRLVFIRLAGQAIESAIFSGSVDAPKSLFADVGKSEAKLKSS